jgi:hypothetical protein
MGAVSSRIVITVLLFVFIIISGFWLSRSGKPYSSLKITLHKLIGLATGIYLAYFVISLYQADQLNTVGTIVVIATILLFLGLAASGGWLSAEKSLPIALSSVHKLFPYLAFGTSTLMVLLLSLG